ncbi:MAG: GGDEF domain-containing protein [Pseudomonadota bacterium]|nr:GGDEF domain-containing protein [Pseudomonadota bacterium]
MPAVRAELSSNPQGRRTTAGRGIRLAFAVGAAFTLRLALAGAGPPVEPAVSPGAATVAELQRTLRGQPEVAIEKLENLIPTLSGQDRVAALVFEGQMCNRLPDDACLERAAMALDVQGRRGDPLAASMAGMLRAIAALRRGPLSRGDHLLAQAWDRIPSDAPDSLRLPLLHEWIRVKQGIGRFDEAVAWSQTSVRLSDRTDVAWQRATTRVDLAYSLWRAQQPEQALATAEAATAIARAGADFLAEAQAAMMRSQLMSDLGRDDEDLRATRDAIRLARLGGDKRVAVLALANLSDHYLRVHDYATALTVAREALPLAREVHYADSESVALSNAGFALILLGRHDEGIGMVRQALAEDERSGAIGFLLDIQHELGDTLERVGRLDEAWTALREYRRLSDDSFRHEQQQAVLELEESFDAERRQNALALLRTETGLKEAQLTAHALQMRVWMVALAAVVLLLGVVVELLRRMRRNNSELQTTNARLQQASESDPLTGLANRRHFRALMALRGNDGVSFSGALILVDLDHFKAVNDEHGHAAGDAVLIEVAARLRQALREQDLAVRWGGEEFLVAIQEMPGEQVRQLAERLLQAIGSVPVPVGALRIPVTASIGFASFPIDHPRGPLAWEHAVDLVDQAMYCAKSQGRNRACGVLRFSPHAGLPEGCAPEDMLSAWRGGDIEIDQLIGPVQHQGGVA